MGLIISARVAIEDQDQERFGPIGQPHQLDDVPGILRVTLSGPFRRSVDVSVRLSQLRSGVSFIFAAISDEVVSLRPHVEASIQDATPPPWSPVAFRCWLMHQEVPDSDVGSLVLRVHAQASPRRESPSS